MNVRNCSRHRLGDASRWVIERRLVLATGIAAAAPVIVSTAKVVTAGWVPLGDDATIAIRAYDVLSAHTPLLGQWSLGFSAVVGEPTYSPGPLLYWLLALPARFLWPSSLEATAGLVNVASVMGIVGLAHRRGGRPLMFAVALAVPIMCASLPAEAYSDIWNPSAALLPFALLLFLAWSLACGDYRLLPLTVLVTSFVAQCHLAYLVPALGSFAVGLGGLLVARRAPPRACARPITVTKCGSLGSWRRWVVASILVGVLCWSAPLIDQAVNRPGNFVLIVRAATADQPTLGLDHGWHAVVHAVGVLPWWLRDPQVPFERIVDLAFAPGAVAVVSTVLVLIGLAGVTLLGWRRPDVRAVGVLGLTQCVALALVTANTPQDSLATLGYSLRWAAPAGMWVWLALGWALGTLLGPIGKLSEVSGAVAVLGRRRALAVVGLGTVAAAGGLAAASGQLRHEPYDEMRTIGARLDGVLPAQAAVRVDSSFTDDASSMANNFKLGIVYTLRRQGRAVVAPAVADSLGPQYVGHGDERVVRVDVDRPPPKRGRPIVRLAVTQYPDPGDPFAPSPPPRREVAVSIAQSALATQVPTGLLDARLTKRNGRLTISRASGEEIPVDHGALDGNLDAVEADGNRLHLAGWAADLRRRQPARIVLAFAHGRLIGGGRVSTPRADLADKFGPRLRRAGFSLLFVNDDARELAQPGHLRVLAISSRRASALPGPH